MSATILTVFCLLFFIRPALAGEISVVTEQWPPYTYLNDSCVCGVVADVVLKALEHSKFEYSIEVLPFARAFHTAERTPNTLIFPILRLPSREHRFKWIKLEGLEVEMALFKPRHRKDIHLTCLNDAQKYRIGVTRETSTHHFLLSRGFRDGVNLFPVHSEELNILKSRPQTKRIDLTTGDRFSLAHWLKKEGMPSDYWVETVPLFKKELYMAFGRSTPDEVVEQVRQAFEDVKQDGFLKATMAKYHYNLSHP